MAFIHGLSGLPEKFEDNLAGMGVGDTFDFRITAEEGYGEFDEEAVVDLPIDIFKNESGELE